MCERNIKFDDEVNDQVLDFKTGPRENWRKLKPQKAKELLIEEGNNAEEILTADLCELLEGGNNGGEENPADSEWVRTDTEIILTNESRIKRIKTI